MAHLVGGHAGQGSLHLIGDQLHGHSQLPLLQALAHTDDGVQPHLQGGVDLLIDGEVGLVVVLAALRVANDNILGPRLLDHLRSDLTGIGAVVLIVAGLRANGDVAVLEQADGGGDIDGRDTQDHVAPLSPGHNGLDLLGELLGLGEGVVHLPVSGNNGLAISSVHGGKAPFYFSFSS